MILCRVACGELLRMLRATAGVSSIVRTLTRIRPVLA